MGQTEVKEITQREAGWKYLLLALGAFAGLGMEMLYAFLLEPLIYGVSLKDFSTTQSILHWILTCITWGGVAYILIYLAKKKNNFDILEKRKKLKGWQWIVAVAFVIFSFIVSYISWNGFKVVKEFQANGLLKFIFQYIYYLFETLLFMLIIVFGQKAFEIWTKKKNVPWGGILCGITWGLSHILSKGNLTVGLLAALSGFMFGAVYLLVNRDIKKTYFFLYLMFVL